MHEPGQVDKPNEQAADPSSSSLPPPWLSSICVPPFSRALRRSGPAAHKHALRPLDAHTHTGWGQSSRFSLTVRKGVQQDADFDSGTNGRRLVLRLGYRFREQAERITASVREQSFAHGRARGPYTSNNSKQLKKVRKAYSSTRYCFYNSRCKGLLDGGLYIRTWYIRSTF